MSSNDSSNSDLTTHDVSVVGITDIQLARESRPALTTVAVPTVEAAELAVQLLLELIEAREQKSPVVSSSHEARVRVTSPPFLLVRASTGEAH